MPNLSQKISKNAEETRQFGAKLGQLLPKNTILALTGDLGGGKTTFTQGLAWGLGVSQLVTSPTFVLAKTFPLKKPGYRYLYHLDLYRLAKKQIDQRVLAEQFSDEKSIMVIEWAAKIKNWLPDDKTIWLNFNYRGNDQRQITHQTVNFTLDKIVKIAYN